jgi:ubiquinone/menaquinone biosynthesis C-methylase UbiE
MEASNKVIKFYGAKNHRIFEIERRCMDRDGVVIRYLDVILPAGKVLDIGAGDGFIAASLTHANRLVVPLEPEHEMIDSSKFLPWTQGVAQELPFKPCSFAAAYATWAYFFPDIGHGDAGLREVHRVVVPQGPIVVVDNAGGDEFCTLSDSDISSNSLWWRSRGFHRQVLTTSFKFDSIEEAQELLSFYFGEKGRKGAKQEVEFKVAVYVSQFNGV